MITSREVSSMGSTEIHTLSTLFVDQSAGLVTTASPSPSGNSTSDILDVGVNTISMVKKLLVEESKEVVSNSTYPLYIPAKSTVSSETSPNIVPDLPFLIVIFKEACSFTSVSKSIEQYNLLVNFILSTSEPVRITVPTTELVVPTISLFCFKMIELLSPPQQLVSPTE